MKWLERINFIRKILSLLLASILIVLSGYLAEQGLIKYAFISQAFGICLYIAWLFTIRDEK